MTLTPKVDRTLARRLRKQLDEDAYFGALKERTLFRGLPPARLPLETLEEISDSIRVVQLRKNEQLDLKQSDSIYEIISGYVKIYDRALKGWEKQKKSVRNPPALLAWRIPGELLGDFRFTKPDAVTDQVVATDECLLMEAPADLLRRLAQDHPQIYLNIACNLASKGVKTRVRAQILRQPNAGCMIAKMFLELLAERGREEAVKDGKAWGLVKGSFYIGDIAAFIGYEYHGTQLALHALIKEGLLGHHGSVKSGRFLCDEEGLLAFLERENRTEAARGRRKAVAGAEGR